MNLEGKNEGAEGQKVIAINFSAEFDPPAR